MNKLLLAAATGLLTLTGTLHAQSFGPAGTFHGGPAISAPCALGVGSITQSVDCAVTPLTSIACHAGGVTTDTSWLRRFFLTADDGIVSNYTVTSVDFGVEVDTPDVADGNLVTVNIYSIAIGDPFLYSNMNLEGSNVIDLDGTTAGTIVNLAVGGTIDPSTDDMVVEVLGYDHSNTNGFGGFFIGANTLGETQDSYIAAADCGITEPTTMTDIGFPGVASVMVVNGSEAGGCNAAIRADVQSLNGKQRVRYDVAVTHNKDDVNVPIYVELRDMSGNTLVVKNHGLRYLARGETVNLKGFINTTALAPGYYMLVARIDRMAGFREIKKMIHID